MSRENSTKRSARQIFTQAVGLNDPPGRAAFLDEACGPDTDLRREVELLLNAVHDANLSPLDGLEAAFSVERTGPDLKPVVGSVHSSGSRQIGPYKLLEQIGLGGMGIVYMAQQTTPVKRKVALKIIKPGMDSQEVIARFEAERQALAMMDHPNIARVLDAGTTCDGLPYFVMELVRGVPLTEFCHEKKVDLEQRLRLFIDVCRAVQHAHQKGIIHRDLKPSNILVTLHDGAPVVKVIDFGVAKARHQELTERTLFTHFSQMIGTPLYMAPEQAEMSGLDIDTRADIYSLGVILYELLTGTTPFEKGAISKLGLDGFRKALREEDPPRPSVRISTLKAANVSTIHDQRTLTTAEFSNKLKRELDWIVMKALEKDRERRYESAAAMAADVKAYLNIEPVSACPPTLVYRLTKHLCRHRTTLAWTGAGVAVLLVCTTLISYFQNRELNRTLGVRRQVELAQREAETAIEAGDLTLAERAVDNARTLVSSDRSVLTDIALNLDSLAAEIRRRQSDLAHYHELLTRAAEAQDRMTYGRHLKGDAAAEVILNNSFGILERDDWLQLLESTYLSKEQKIHAKDAVYETLLCLADCGPRWYGTTESVKRSLELLERAEAFHPPTKALHWVRSECHRILDEPVARDQALALFDATRAMTALDHYLPGHTAGWRGDGNSAIEAYRAALRIQPAHYNSLFFLAERLQKEKRYAEAIAYYTACLAIRPNHVFAILGRAEAFENSADMVSAELDFRAASEAEATQKEHVYAVSLLIEFYRRSSQHEQHAAEASRLSSECELLIAAQTEETGLLGTDTLELISELGVVLCNADRYTDGIPLLESVLERQRNLFEGANETTLKSLQYLGECLLGSERVLESGVLLEEALAMSKVLYGPDHETTLLISRKLGHIYSITGRAEQGLPLLENALAQLDIVDRENHLNTLENLGWANRHAGNWDKAITLLEQTLVQRIEHDGPSHERTLQTKWLLASTLDQAGKPEAAVPLLEEALNEYSRRLGPNAKRTLVVLNDLAVAQINLGRADIAIPLLARCVEQHRRDQGPEHGKTLVATFNLALAYSKVGQHSEAASLFKSLIETHTRRRSAIYPETLDASNGLLETYRKAGWREEGKRLVLSDLETARKHSHEIDLSAFLALSVEELLDFDGFEEAEPLARECLQLRGAELPDSWLYFNAQSMLGGALLGQEKYQEAEPLLLQAIEGFDRHLENIPEFGRSHIDVTITRLIRLYESTGQSELAACWQVRQRKNATTREDSE